MSERHDVVWQDPALVRTFVEGVRGGIPNAADQLEVMLRLLEARGAPVEVFMDLGCGSGVLAQAILARWPSARGVLVDFSGAMLEAAQAVLSAYAGQLDYVAADYGDPVWLDPLPLGVRYDAIVSGFSIHHQPDENKRRVYAEIFSLLKPGGFFINIEHVASPTRWLEAQSDALMVDSIYAYHARQGTGKTREQIANEYAHRPDKSANILAPVEAQCGWLRALGYQDVDCFFKVFELAVFGGRRPAGGSGA